MGRQRRRPQHRSRKSQPAPRLKADADSSLKPIFAQIGVPQKGPFHPDPFQLAAVAAIENGDCLVSAPTGAGKTWIAVEAIRQKRAQNLRCWYATPLKALSNAKYREFSAIFGNDQVGILTGDRKENPSAPIIIGTTEILRNQLYDAMHLGQSLTTDLVVLDEAHYLGDPDRGVVWEEVMIYLPARIPLLLLSATIGNIDQVAAWLTQIRPGVCQLVTETQRPVPLTPLFMHPKGTLYPLLDPRRRSAHISPKVARFAKRRRPARIGGANRLPPFDQVLNVFRRFNLLPAIIFLKSRADCDRALQVCRRRESGGADRSARRKLRLRQLTADSLTLRRHRQLRDIHRGAVAAHHGGQLPAWKLVVEALMGEGLLDAVFATSTVAAGVNFPARTVAFLNTDRFNGREFLPLSGTEYQQMVGRAGRRGMDKIGFAVMLAGKYMDPFLAAKLAGSGPSDVDSQIDANFSMILNLLLSHTPAQIDRLFERSFAAFQAQQRRPSKQPRGGSGRPVGRDLTHEFQRHLNFLIKTGFVLSSGRLSDDGLWASQLRVDQPLLIAEALRCGCLPTDDPRLLAAVIAAFVHDRDRGHQGLQRQRLSAGLGRQLDLAVDALTPMAKNLTRHGFDVRRPAPAAAGAVFAWACGSNWEDVFPKAEIAEGDLAMLILRTADNLRHIRTLGQVFAHAAQTAGEAIGLLLREPLIDDEIETGQRSSDSAAD